MSGEDNAKAEYVDADTGEIVTLAPGDVDARRHVPVEDVPIDLTDLSHDPRDLAWLGDWYTRAVTLDLAELDARKRAYERVTRGIKARMAMRRRRWGEALERVAQEDMARDQRRSVTYACGSVALRSSERIVVDDEAAAIEWAREHAPRALRVVESVRKTELPVTCPYAHRERVEALKVEGDVVVERVLGVTLAPIAAASIERSVESAMLDGDDPGDTAAAGREIEALLFEREAAERAPAQPECRRHTYGEDGACSRCGATRQRAPRKAPARSSEVRPEVEAIPPRAFLRCGRCELNMSMTQDEARAEVERGALASCGRNCELFAVDAATEQWIAGWPDSDDVEAMQPDDPGPGDEGEPDAPRLPDRLRGDDEPDGGVW